MFFDYVMPLLSILLLGGFVWMAAVYFSRSRRRRLGDKVNRPLVVPERPLVVGPLRDACTGGLLGAALGDAQQRRNRADVLRYGVGPQLMLCACRSFRADGALARRRYRLELGYLARYQTGARAGLRRLLETLRREDLDTSVQSKNAPGAMLFTAIPVGILWHDRPQHAASIARDVIRSTHSAAELIDGAAIVAATMARMVQYRGKEECEPIHGRRAMIEKLLADVGGAEGPAAVAILTTPDLAAVEPLLATEHLQPTSEEALEVLQCCFYLLFRYSTDAGAALEAAASMDMSPSACGLATALIGARMGRGSFPEATLKSLQHRPSFEIHGEKLAMADPSVARSTSGSAARLISASVVSPSQPADGDQ